MKEDTRLDGPYEFGEKPNPTNGTHKKQVKKVVELATMSVAQLG